MRTLTIVGARPQFIKIGPVCRAIERYNRSARDAIEDLILHTGQHYDDDMSKIFFDELAIPRPAINLEIGSGGHGEQTGRMLMGIEKVIVDTEPDVVVIYGDTNSTVAGALAAAKLQVPVAHVEAGLRSFNRAMPEEINRIVADHVSDVLYAPTETACEHLAKEGLGSKTIRTGDVMLDAVEFNRTLATCSAVLERLRYEPGEFILATIHRAESTTDSVLPALMDLLNTIAVTRWPIVLPMHPRTRAALARCASGWKPSPRLHIVDPVGYLENLYMIERARYVLTDSGGLQKEAYFLDTPCVTLRTETEWPETVDGGGNVVAGLSPESIAAAIDHWEARVADNARGFSEAVHRQFGGGRASDQIIEHLVASFGNGRS